eukprot:1345687-Pyramimonas_sp.AAC.1
MAWMSLDAALTGQHLAYDSAAPRPKAPRNIPATCWPPGPNLEVEAQMLVLWVYQGRLGQTTAHLH